ncbi:hypothetical protein [Bacillus tequilensis]|uniref:hypothetical protein n=1 Tax=Bacillus tequilensis TaxID=227866 RepID=UPI0020C6E7CC|nr:hypothetical protein [Bacillus tequilensis]
MECFPKLVSNKDVASPSGSKEDSRQTFLTLTEQEVETIVKPYSEVTRRAIEARI